MYYSGSLNIYILIFNHLQRRAETVLVVHVSITVNFLVAIPIQRPPLNQLLANSIFLQQLRQAIPG